MFKKFLISLCIFVGFIYALFLICPLFLNGIANSYIPEISKIIEENSSFKVKIESIKIITTPKLTIGGKVGQLEVALPNGEKFLTASNVQGKLSLIPLLAKKIEIDMVGADDVNCNLKVKNDGKFLLEDFIPQTGDIQKNKNKEENQVQNQAGLPFGLNLSNHLPNITINNYNLSFVDIPTDKTYSIYGDNISFKDFVLNKSIKISALGKVILQDKEQFNYDIKLFNKIMPDVDLNDIVFAQPQVEEEQPTQEINFNIIDIFKSIYKNQLTADLHADIKTSGSVEDIDIQGEANISNISVGVDGKPLPASNLDLKFKGNSIKLYSKLFTSEKETTEFVGNIRTGKNPYIDLNCKSNAKFQSIIDVIDSIAKSFDYKDLDTLTATGGIDADFTIKSNLKKIESSGYLKIPQASLAYKIYNIAINKISVDIDLANNMINIKDAGLTILEQPLKIKGIIQQDATADLTILADKLQIKGLLLALGQVALLKENQINSGTLSLNTTIKGKLDKIAPKIALNIDNVNVKNIPSNTSVTLANSKVNLTTDGKKTDGVIDVSNAKVINPMATISLPIAKITLGEKDIDINSGYILLNNSRIDIMGKIADYMSKNINFNLNAKGSLLASDIKTMIPKDFRNEIIAKGSLPLSIKITGNDKTQDISFDLTANPSNYASIIKVDQLNGKNTSIKGNIKINGDTLKFNDTGIYANGTALAYLRGGVNDLYKSQKLDLNFSTPSQISFVIPFFSKSKMQLSGDINILGNALNPILKGSLNIPSINIPEIPVSMNSLNIILNGPIAKGNGTLNNFKSGGIVAENLSSDFNLTNNVFYLKNLTGNAFDGKINGNISYNVVNGHIGVDFKGLNMNAEKAIAGAAGIKNALSGKLGFSANVTLHGATDVEMMKNLKGKVSFDITDGQLGNLGRFENFLLAQNLQSNSIIKAAVSSIKALPQIKNTAEFKTISGNLNFSNGWADLNPVKTSGPSMAYYITGKYNLLNGTANVVILGRISAEIVSLLGPLGELSVSKLTSYIPKFGTATGNIINALTSNPKGEKISEIPALSSGNKNYKDFKVQFNGGVESSSSVKSFKWLSNCDTSAIEKVNIKDQIQTTKQAIQEAKEQKVQQFTQMLDQQRQQAQQSKQQMQNAVEGLKNFKNLLK